MGPATRQGGSLAQRRASIADEPLGDLGSLLSTVSDPAAVMRRIAEEAVRLIAAAEGAVVELIDGDDLRCVCAIGTLRDLLGASLSLGSSLSGLAVRSTGTLHSHHTATDPRVDRATALRVDAASLICVPLRGPDRPVGALTVAATSPFAFSDRDVATLAGLSAFLTAAVTAASSLNAAADELISEAAAADESGVGRDTAGMSNFVTNVLGPGVLADLQAARLVEETLADHLFHVVYQPIVDIEDGRVVMAEALSRFPAEPYRPPNAWFADAWRAGFGPQLELAALEVAVDGLARLPKGMRLAINLSPEVITHRRLESLLPAKVAQRLVIELTEHVRVDDYHQVRQALARLRSQGVQLAIDDTGAGFASLSHIIKLEPDIIKLDRELIHGIGGDPVRRSLALAIVTFAAAIGAEVVAEAVEEPEELKALRSLGVHYGQGMLLAPPGPAELVPLEVNLDRYPEPSLLSSHLGLMEPPSPSVRNPHPRGEATRQRVIESLLSLLEEGGPMPTMTSVAQAAGVSVRLVYHHFHDVETLFRSVMATQVARHWNNVTPVSPALALDVRVDRTVRQRATLFDAITPVRRAGMARLDRCPDIAAGLTASDAQLRMWLEHTFSPELSAAGPSGRRLLEAVEAATSWEAWDRLRRGQRLSMSAASDAMARTLRALFATVTS